MNKKYSFFFHYNKPQSKLNNKPIISIHYRGNCMLVENIVCNVPTKGKINKRQPFFVVCGKAQSIEIINKIAFIK